MQFDFNTDLPIFVQVAEQIESAILSGALEEGAQAPSTTEISVLYKINPATALKGVSMLADDGVLFKKRGLGMFVADGAKERIVEKRRSQFYEKYVVPLVIEAVKLGLSTEQLDDMIRRGLKA